MSAGVTKGGTRRAKEISGAAPLQFGFLPNLESVPFLGRETAEELRKLSCSFLVVSLIPPLAANRLGAPKGHSAPVTLRCLSELAACPFPSHVVAQRAVRPGQLGDFAFGDVTVHFAGMEVRRRGAPTELRSKEYKTLVYMIQNSGRVLSLDELLSEVWGYRCYPCTRTVDNHILQLRRKLEPDPTRPKHFLTVHSTGYKFLP